MFLQKYKKLDNLCKDLLRSEKGVSAYIEAMERGRALAYKVPGWEEDYRNLKKYRHIRNRIAHEDGADEASLCAKADEKWIDNFYQRILDRRDPLALGRKANRVRHTPPAGRKKNTRRRGALPAFLFALLVLALICGAVYLLTRA